MDLFRADNTEGYNQAQLDALNAEWQERVEKLNLDEFTEEYDEQAKCFADEVARR